MLSHGPDDRTLAVPSDSSYWTAETRQPDEEAVPAGPGENGTDQEDEDRDDGWWLQYRIGPRVTKHARHHYGGGQRPLLPLRGQH